MSSQMLFILVLSILSPQKTWGESDETTWVEPNAWSRNAAPAWKLNSIIQGNKIQIHTDCTVCEKAAIEEQVALIYYKKLITNLFNRKKLWYDEHADQYKGSLQFSLLRSQLEKLEKLNDPRDLDILLTELIANAHTTDAFVGSDDSDNGIGIVALISDMASDLFVLLKTTEIKFTLILLTVILIGWFLHDRYKIGVVRLTLIGIFLFGYYIKYLECNRKLENDELIQFMHKDEFKLRETNTWLSQVLKLVSWNDKMVQSEKVRKSEEIKMPFCRPDHVFMMYANELFFKQFEFTFEAFSSTMYRLSDILPWPINTVVPVLTPFILLYFVYHVFELVFKFILSPRAWADLRAPRHSYLQNQLNEDRISGENLRLFLNTMKTSNILNNVSQLPTPMPKLQELPVSGVEEVLEQKEYLSEHSSKQKSNSTSPNTSVAEHNETTKSKLALQDARNDVDQHLNAPFSSLESELTTNNV